MPKAYLVPARWRRCAPPARGRACASWRCSPRPSYGLRPHPDPAPVAAAHLAPSKLLAEAGLVERFREGAWAFFRLAERGASADARARAGRAARRRRPDRSRATASGSRRCARRAPTRRRPISARMPASGTASARCTSPSERSRPRSATALGRAAVPLAARSRHRHRPHARTVRRRASSAALGIDSRLDMLRLRAREARARGPAPLQRAPGRHLRSAAARRLRSTSSSSTRCCTSSTTGARAIARGGARAARRAAGCWWSISRRTISNSCARSTPIAGSALRPRQSSAGSSAAGLDVAAHRELAPEPRLRRQARGVALARARSAQLRDARSARANVEVAA